MNQEKEHKEIPDIPGASAPFTRQFETFLGKYKAYLEQKKQEESKDVPKIHVDEIAAKIARFYERTRNVVDYREEHLLHKHFVARTLRRRLLLANGNKNVAEGFIREVIRAGHLPNDAVPETRIEEIQDVIDTYRAITQRLTVANPLDRQMLEKWLLRITISEVDELLFPYDRDETLRNFMFKAMREHLTITPSKLDSEGEATQLFVAVERALLHSDDDQIKHRLFRFLYPAWTAPEKNIDQICTDLPQVRATIEEHLHHELGKYFLTLARRYATVFRVIGDITAGLESFEEIMGKFKNTITLEIAVGEAYQARFKKERGRLRRLATLSVISFLLSKIAVAIAIEYPVDKYLTHEYSPMSTLLNVFVPPLLMLICVLVVRMPGEENATLVLNEIMRTVYGGEVKSDYSILIPKKNVAFEGIVSVAYAITFFVSFIILYRVLRLADFSMANFLVFAFFTSLVAATATKIHNRAKSISLEKKRRTFLSFVKDLFVMPFVIVGKWSLLGLQKFNFLVFMADLIIEAPFQVFVEFIESFSFFIKSKKEEIH